MPDNIDSISIELTADTSSAEESLNKLIGRLALLKVAVQGASNFTKIAGGIQRIAEAARKIETDSGEKLSNLAHGLMELSKVGDLSHLGAAAKNLSSVIKAASGSGNSANLGGLANGIRGVRDALGGITDSDVDRLGAVSDALSGETSGPIHTSSIGNESTEMGGTAPSSIMAMQGADAFLSMADNVTFAERAFRSFTMTLGGVNKLMAQFVHMAHGVENAMERVGNTGWTWGKSAFNWARAWAQSRAQQLGEGASAGAQRLLNDVPNFTTGSEGIDKSKAIEIKDLGESAADAAEKFERLSDAERFANFSMKPLEDEAGNTSARLRETAEQASRTGGFFSKLMNNAKNAASHMRLFGKSAKKAGDDAEKGTSGMSKFLASLKRIAYYRFIRAILREIAQAFKEGAQNLYQWSGAHSGLSDFKKNMDRIATSVLYLKNSLGAMLEPLVRILAPIIDWVVDKLVWVIDKITQFFAALTGATTYTAAKKVATTWGDAAQDVASSTHKAADDIKRTILGFDEINKLQKQDTSSYSGGSGSSGGASVNDMFEEKPLEGWAKFFSDIVNKIKEIFGKIKDFFDGIFGPIKQLFTDAGSAFDDLNRSLDAAQREEKDIIINIKTNPSDPSKIFDEITNGWDSLKNKTLFVTIRPATLTEYLFKLISDSWDKLEGKTLFVNIMLSQKAAYLWETLKNAWDSLQGKTLFSNVQLSQKATYLWETLKSAWDSITDKVLYANVALSQKATYLWDTLKNAWDGIQNKVLYTEVMFSQKANYLWTTLSDAWDGIQGKVLYVNVEFSQKAKYLWTTLQSAWNGIQNKVVYLNVSLSQSANYLWDTLENAWDGIQNKVVYASVSLSQSANYLWTTLKSAWDNIRGKVVYLTVEFTQKANYLWTTLQSAWNGIQNKAVYLNVSLSQSANYLWDTLKNAWDGIQNKVFYVEVELKKKDWTTVTNFVDDSFGGASSGGGKTSGGGAGRSVSVGVKLQENTSDTKSKSLWNMWWDIFQKTLSIEQSILMKLTPGWTGTPQSSLKIDSLSSNVTFNGVPGASLKLSGTNTYTLKGLEDTSVQAKVDATGGTGTYLGNDNKIHLNSIPGRVTHVAVNAQGGTATYLGDDQKLHLEKIPGRTAQIVANAIGGDGTYYKDNKIHLDPVPGGKTKISVSAVAAWASTIGGIFAYLGIPADPSTVITAKAEKGWTGTYKSKVGADDTTSSITASLEKAWGTQKPLDYLKLSGLSTTIKVGLKPDDSKIKVRVQNGEASLESATKRTENVETPKALGGVFSNGRWSRIPQYASGTTNAHGSLFLAGEAGPEIVGHVGGRTEVLNKSQLASAMFSAVRSAMQGVQIDASLYGGFSGDSGNSADSFAEYMRMDAEEMRKQNELLRQQNELLRQINDKEFTAEVSTMSFNKAQRYANKRAGQTIVPVTI